MSRGLLTIGSALLVTLLICAPASAQRLVGALSEKNISIDSSFSGETLTIFGDIEPDHGEDQSALDGPYDIVVVVRGPAIDRVARRKTNDFGIWINTQQVLFRSFPSFHWTLSSNVLSNIATPEVLAKNGILPGTDMTNVDILGNGNVELFRKQLIRMMTDRFLYGVQERGVLFRSKTLYSAQVTLPASIPDGNFLAQTYLFKEGEVVGYTAEGFQIRKTGFERFLGETARDNPFAYGFVCVLLAVGTGWLGGVIFRR